MGLAHQVTKCMSEHVVAFYCLTSKILHYLGFGVCCIFEQMTCGGTVSENCTYIQNEGYDTGYSPGTATETCVVSSR